MLRTHGEPSHIEEGGTFRLQLGESVPLNVLPEVAQPFLPENKLQRVFFAGGQGIM